MIGPTLVALVAVVTQGSAEIALPAPTGPYAVGTRVEQWTDASRSDSLTGAPGGRHISAQLWYPAEHDPRSTPAPYAPGVAPTDGDYGRLMATVRTHATLAAPFARRVERAPVILLSTGRSMAAYDYTSLAEELASHGYVVVGVNSPQLSRFFLPDGSAIPPMPAPPMALLQHFDSADVYFEPMIRLVAGDLHFAVERLAEMDGSDRVLGRHLDLTRMGMMGHSNGAIAGSRACAQESRCLAYLGIEGTQSRELRKGGVTKPYALLISEQSLGFDAENVYRELGARSPDHYRAMIVRGAGHNTFTDLLLVRPTLFTYAIDIGTGVAITRTAVHEWFDRTLRRTAPLSSLPTSLTRYPQVTVQTSFPAAAATPPRSPRTR